MPLPTPAEMRDRTKTNAQMREMMAQIAGNALSKSSALPLNDLNQLVEEGFYYVNPNDVSALLNKPDQVSGSIFIVVRKLGPTSNIIMQEIVDNQLQSFKRRRPNATDWTEWVYYPKQTDMQNYVANSIATKPLSNSDDLNNFIQSGTYMTTTNGNILNVPFDVKAAFTLTVVSRSYGSSTVIYQTLIDNNNVEYKRRTADSGVIWTDWVNSSRTPLPVPNNADLNTYIYNGVYHSSATGVLNGPPQATGSFILEVVARKPTTLVVVYQTLTNHQNAVFKRRSIDGGATWSQWKTISYESTLLTTSSELDMNKIHSQGVYFGATDIIASVLNKPTEVTAAFKLNVDSNQVTSTNKVVYQTLTNHQNRTWSRRTPNYSVSTGTATWTDWVEEVTSSNIANIVAPLIPEVPSGSGVFGSYVKEIGSKLSAYQITKIADINHLLSYGQSLSIGAGGQPAISLTQYASNLTFDGGPRAASGSYLPLKPLTEDDRTAPDGGANRGETLCAGAANYASHLMLKENGIKPTDHVILSTAGGRGGYRISQLNKGTTWYKNNMLAHITNAVNYCNTNNLTYSMPMISWAQGEFDQNKTDITREQGAELLEQLQVDVQTDIKARSGMQTRIPFVTYQTSWYVKKANHISLAQLDVVKRNEDFYFSTPMYHLPHASDNLHLNNVGNKLFGCYVGRVYKQLVIDQIHPEFLCPLSAEMQGTKIIVRFHVPKAPMVLDAVNLAATTDHGFKVVDDAGATVAHSTIAVSSDGTKIEIELGAVPTNPIKVRYALDYLGAGLNIGDGASGNLRDSTDDQVSFDGNTYNLWHVCPHFELDVLNLQV